MALIKCSECGADISEKATVCPKCGCPIDITKRIILDEKKNKVKKLSVIVICSVCLIGLILVGYNIFLYNTTPVKKAECIVKKDFGKDIEIENIYYNSEVNGCIVEFLSNGKEDVATVHLDDNIVGYKSIFDDIENKINNAANDDDKEKYMEEYVHYAEQYDITWYFNLILNDESGWEEIE